MEDAMSKKIVILLVGVGRRDWEDQIKKLADIVAGKSEDAFLDGLKSSVAPEKVSAEFETNYFDSFKHAAHACWENPDVDLVCVADQHAEIGFTGLVDGLEMLTNRLTEHPNRPAVFLFDKRMYP